MEKEERRGTPDRVSSETKTLANPIRILVRKFMTLFLFLTGVLFVALIFIGLEYENDHKDRNEFGAELQHVVMEIEDACPDLTNEKIDVIQFRYVAKQKFVEMHQMQNRLGIRDDYREEAWTVMGSFFFVLSTITTIGYGYPAPKTPEGKLTTMLLYVAGVPITFIAVMDIVEIIFILEKLIGLKIHNNTVQFREKLRLFLLKICFWCKETSEPSDSQIYKKKAQESIWRRRLKKEIRIRNRKARRHWKIKTEERKLSMRALGYVMDETDSDSTEIKPPIQIIHDAMKTSNPTKQKINRSTKKRKTKDKRDQKKADASVTDTGALTTVEMLPKESSKMERKQAWVDVNSPPATENDSDSGMLRIPQNHTQLKSSFTDALPSSQELDEEAIAAKQPVVCTKTAWLTYVNETKPKHKRRPKSSTVLATAASCGHLAEKASGHGYFQRFTEYLRRFASDSKIYEKPHGITDDLESGNHQPGNYNECNNKPRPKSWHVHTSRRDSTSSDSGDSSVGWMPMNSDCVIQMEEDNEEEQAQVYNGGQERKAVPQDHESHSECTTSGWNMLHRFRYSTSEVRESASDLPSVHKPIQPFSRGSDARFDFSSSSTEDLHPSLPRGSDLDAVECGIPVGRPGDQMERTTTKTITRSEQYHHMDKRMPTDQILDQLSAKPCRSDSDLILGQPSENRKPRHKKYQVLVGGNIKTVCWKKFTKTRKRSRMEPALRKRAFMKYPKDPMHIPMDIEGLLQGEKTLRKLQRERKRRAAAKIPPVITLTNPEKETKVIFCHAKRRRAKSAPAKPSQEQKQVAEKGNGGVTPPYNRFRDDEPHDTKVPEFSSGFTVANLLIYMFFGAIMYVKVQQWSYLDAIYFLFTSISTVGYGDFLPDGEVFLLLSSLYVLLGLALLAKVVADIRGSAFSIMVDTEQAIIRKLEEAGQKAKSGITRSARRVFGWRNRAVGPGEMEQSGDRQDSKTRKEDTLAPPVEKTDSGVALFPNVSAV